MPAVGQEAVQPQRPSQHETESGQAGGNGSAQRTQESPATSTSLTTDENTGKKAEGNREAKPQYIPNEPLWDWRPYVVVTPGDTLAQWVIAMLGIAATVISGVAVYLVWKTLKATRDTLNEAREATKAAMQSADAARDMLHAERAWVVQTSFEVNELVNYWTSDGEIKHSIGFVFQFMNVGRSPARNVELDVKYRIVESSEPVPRFEFNS